MGHGLQAIDGTPSVREDGSTGAYPGTQVFILGNDLTGATSVKFGGEAAEFTVVSSTEIIATVPKDPCMVTVQVVTPAAHCEQHSIPGFLILGGFLRHYRQELPPAENRDGWGSLSCDGASVGQLEPLPEAGFSTIVSVGN